ncbi:DUF937 domain-containing protein [Propionicicella superfundia]|uniref:DUF937 domain-containing protein n=1 Tax=Propionicicella superfundia TaxID=348582 RepID=UPI000423D47A|nr:DUF937 domain-containing protein [Propionicicella superfundia]
MSDTSELLDLIPISQIADRLGVDAATAEAGVAAALPTLLGGMQANAQDPAGAASLVSALETKDSSLVDGGVDLAAVDTADGEKIVRHVFGDNKDQVIATLGSAPGTQSSDLVAKLLPILAPIVLSYLAGKFLNQGGAAQAQTTAQGSGGIGDLLGGILGGLGGSSSASTGGGLGGLLGGLLGGGASSGSGSDPLGDLLGGLLGGGTR